MGKSFSLSVLHPCVMELSPVKQLVCSPLEAPALRWSLPYIFCLRNGCAYSKLHSWFSALLNQGLEHSWLDAAGEIPLKIIKSVLESCIWILGKCGCAYLWGSWILFSKGPNQTVALNTCYLCRIQTSLCSSQTSPLARFQIGIIFKVHFVSCCKFYFHSQSKGEHFGKIWAKKTPVLPILNYESVKWMHLFCFQIIIQQWCFCWCGQITQS